jgi:hypothetical protein
MQRAARNEPSGPQCFHGCLLLGIFWLYAKWADEIGMELGPRRGDNGGEREVSASLTCCSLALFSEHEISMRGSGAFCAPCSLRIPCGFVSALKGTVPVVANGGSGTRLGPCLSRERLGSLIASLYRNNAAASGHSGRPSFSRHPFSWRSRT